MKASAAQTRIIEGTARLFYEQGYNTTGINQIIKETNVAKRSLYKHFPSKRDLLTAYISHAEEQWFKQLDEYLQPESDPREKLLKLVDFRIERQLRSKFGGCQFIKISAEIPQDDHKAFEQIERQKKRLRAVILQILEEGVIHPKSGMDLSLLADTIFLLLEGATVNASISKDVAPLRQAKKAIAALV